MLNIIFFIFQFSSVQAFVCVLEISLKIGNFSSYIIFHQHVYTDNKAIIFSLFLFKSRLFTSMSSKVSINLSIFVISICAFQIQIICVSTYAFVILRQTIVSITIEFRSSMGWRVVFTQIVIQNNKLNCSSILPKSIKWNFHYDLHVHQIAITQVCEYTTQYSLLSTQSIS